MNPNEMGPDGPTKALLQDDRGILVDLMQMLPSEGIIEFLRSFSFGNAYRQDFIDPLYQFIDLRGGPEHEFIDPQLEKSRKELRVAIQAFLSVLRKNTFRQREMAGNHTFCRIPDEWEMTQGRRYHQAIADMNAAAGDICKRYDELVRTARAHLQTDTKTEPPPKSENRVDQVLSWAKNNWLVSSLIVLAIAVGGVSALLTNISSILDHFRSEHTLVIATKLSSEDVLYNGKTLKDEVVVQFDPKDSRQKFQQIIIDFPPLSNYSATRRTVAPPFKEDVGFQFVALNGVLQTAIPEQVLQEPYHSWICTDSVPIVLTVEYFTSSGESQTDKMLYEMDFTFIAYQMCDMVGGCEHGRWGASLNNVRFARRLAKNDDPQSTMDAELAHKHFKFEPGR
jgi:hypothetical protein